MNASRTATFVLALAALAHGQPASSPAADWILTGGKIATLRHGLGLVDSIALRDGVVHAVGTREEMMVHRGEATRVLDLRGRTVVPGLNDSHLHVVRGGRFFHLELRWDGVRTLERALNMVREQAARTPKGQWVRVIGGWSPHQFTERRMPTIEELNEAAPDTPVFVLYLYSRGFLNRAGVEALGIDETTKPPVGGRYEFRDGGAELHATPNPTILYQTIGKLPHLTEDQRLNSTIHFYRELNAFGLTSAVDAGGGGHVFPEDYGATAELARRGELTLRIASYLFPQRPGRELEDFRHWTNTYRRAANIALSPRQGYVLRGGGEFLVWSGGDFENFLAPRPHLQERMDQEMGAVAEWLVRQRWPFRIHATYGESIDRILDVLARVDERVPFDGLRWAIDHAETIRPDQIQRIQRMGGGIAIQNRMAFAGEDFLERYGSELAAQAPPLRQLVDSGVPLGAGTDATRVSSHDPWLALSWMVTGRTIGGTILYPEEQRLTREEALRLYTVGSAWFAEEEDRKGTLAPGQFADLAVLSDDYFTVAEEDIAAIRSVLTLVGGHVVHGSEEFAALAPELPPVEPSWSPVAHFGGHQRLR